jgi:hypothetical protein
LAPGDEDEEVSEVASAWPLVEETEAVVDSEVESAWPLVEDDAVLVSVIVLAEGDRVGLEEMLVVVVDNAVGTVLVVTIGQFVLLNPVVRRANRSSAATTRSSSSPPMFLQIET